MTSVSISQLKASPAKVISAAGDYPVAIQSGRTTEAYLVGRRLFEMIERYIEDYIDRKAIEETDFSKGEELEKVAGKLGI